MEMHATSPFLDSKTLYLSLGAQKVVVAALFVSPTGSCFLLRSGPLVSSNSTSSSQVSSLVDCKRRRLAVGFMLPPFPSRMSLPFEWGKIKRAAMYLHCIGNGLQGVHLREGQASTVVQCRKNSYNKRGCMYQVSKED